MGGLSKAANGTPSLGSSNAPESRLPSACGLSPAQVTRDITVVTSHSPATSGVSTALVKALYTPPSYRQTVTTTETLTPTVSSTSTTGGRLGTTAASATSVAITRSSMPTVTAATAKTNGCQTVFASARSQYLQRVGGLNAPVTTTSQYLQRVGGLNAPVTTTSQPGTTTSQYLQRVGGLNAPVTTTSQPGTTTSQPGTTTSQYLQRVGGLNAPVTTTSQPVTTTSQPGTITSQYLQRVGGLNGPVTTTSQPGTTTSQPGTITSQYLQRVGGLSAPVTTTSQPVTTMSQYLQRVGGLNAPVSITSTAAVCMPAHSTEKVGRNIGRFAAAKPDSGVVSRYSQPLSRCVAADRPQTTLSASNTTMSHRNFTCSSSQNVATKTSVTAACVASTEVSWSSGVSSCPLTRVTTSSSDGYLSPFLEDKMRGATVTQRAPMMSLHVPSMNSTPVTSHHQVTAVTAADRPLRTPQQHSSAKNSAVDGSDSDRAMVSSLLQKLTEARQRKQQSRYDSLASVPAVEHHLPVDSVVPVSSTAVSLRANIRTTANSRTGNVSSNKTEWQLEVERRQMARSGIYIDPEKHPKEAAKQHVGQHHGKEDMSTLSEVPRKTLGTETRLKMNSASSSVDTAAADRMRSLRVAQRQVTGSHISDVSPLHLHATRSEQDRFKSKKSASSTFQLLCILQSYMYSMGDKNGLFFKSV